MPFTISGLGISPIKSILLSLALAATSFAADKAPILLVLTNHSKLGDTGKLTGFFLSEAAHPYEVFTEKDHPVTLASPKGGFAPLDPKSMELSVESRMCEPLCLTTSQPRIPEREASGSTPAPGHLAEFSYGKRLVLYVMQPDDAWQGSGSIVFEMASHRIPDHFPQFLDAFALGSDDVSQGYGDIAAIDLILTHFENHLLHQ